MKDEEEEVVKIKAATIPQVARAIVDNEAIGLFPIKFELPYIYFSKDESKTAQLKTTILRAKLDTELRKLKFGTSQIMRNNCSLSDFLKKEYNSESKDGGITVEYSLSPSGNFLYKAKVNKNWVNDVSALSNTKIKNLINELVDNPAVIEDTEQKKCVHKLTSILMRRGRVSKVLS